LFSAGCQFIPYFAVAGQFFWSFHTLWNGQEHTFILVALMPNLIIGAGDGCTDLKN
jgi:hypothetical protein